MSVIGFIVAMMGVLTTAFGASNVGTVETQQVTESRAAPIVEEETTSLETPTAEIIPAKYSQPKVVETSIKPTEALKPAPVQIREAVPAKTQKSACHPSYSGCLEPNASDYDCAGGSGNGPYYTGPVRVLGPDIFDLDRDGDGVACE